MRRAIPGIAVLAAGLLYLTGCTAGGAPAGGAAPSADGIGPITFAIGKDNSGWLQGVITGWNTDHPGQKVTLLLLPEAANDQLAQLVANLQAQGTVILKSTARFFGAVRAGGFVVEAGAVFVGSAKIGRP